MSNQVTIYIDNKEIKATKGENLLQVALQNNIKIPNLCYHKKLTPTGACRLCITKIEGQRGFVTSCSTSVSDGMKVTAFDSELENERKHTLDYLVSEHNEAYDGTYNDELKDLLERYDLTNPKNRKAPSIWKKQENPIDDTSPILTYDASKCIKCFRCVKACSEVQGKDVLTMAERGIHSYIVAGVGVWKESECDGCGECVQLCPTGAIVEKPYREIINLEKVEKKVRTTCSYCGVGCQLNLYVQDGKIVRADGVEGAMPNDGRLCVKGRFGYEYVHSKDRLTTPLIRKNGELVEASWEEALTLVANKFSEIKEKYGSNALAGFSSAKCTNEENYIFQKFIRTAFGTNNLDYCTRLCHASTVVAMLRSIGDGAASNSIQDYASADCIFITGNNMIETHPVTATYVKQGKKNGACIIVCDPKWTPMVKYADIWLQPKLGTDVALLNGMIKVIIDEGLIDENFIKNKVSEGFTSFEKLKQLTEKYNLDYVSKITNIKAETIKKAAIKFAKADKTMIATGMGMSQQVTGTDNVFSLLNLSIITGKLGKKGSGMNPPRGQNNVQGATDVGASPIFYPGYISVRDDENRKRLAKLWNVDYESLPGNSGLTTVEIVKSANENGIKGIYVMGENPLHTDPNLNHTEEAFKKMEFVVVQDIFPTLTTQFADVILPAASWAEKNGTFVSSDRRVLRVRPAIKSPGEARPDWEILTEVARRMGVNMPHYKNESEIFDELAIATPIMSGVSHERLENEEIQWPCTDKNHPGTPDMLLDGFNTPDKKAKIIPVDYIEQEERKSKKYPFILNSGRILYHYHSSTMSSRNKSLNDFANEAYVLMNVEDIKSNGFKDGQKVKITSKQGTLITRIQASDKVAIGELFMPWHFQESLVNKLTRDDLDPLSKIAPFKLSACRVDRLREEEIKILNNR